MAKQVSIDETLQQIEEVLDRMEQDGVPLEEAFRCYEQGMKLIKSCNEKLDTVEKKMQIINEEGEYSDFQG